MRYFDVLNVGDYIMIENFRMKRKNTVWEAAINSENPTAFIHKYPDEVPVKDRFICCAISDAFTKTRSCKFISTIGVVTFISQVYLERRENIKYDSYDDSIENLNTKFYQYRFLRIFDHRDGKIQLVIKWYLSSDQNNADGYA